MKTTIYFFNILIKIQKIETTFKISILNLPFFQKTYLKLKNMFKVATTGPVIRKTTKNPDNGVDFRNNEFEF